MTHLHQLSDFKLASYLDEAGEEPAGSCDTLLRHDIRYIILRNIWGDKNICECNDISCQKIRRIISDKGLSVVSISSNLGNIPVNKLPSISDSQISHAFDIASYYKAESIRFMSGTAVDGDYNDLINDWLAKISHLAVVNNITPLLEITYDSHMREPADVARSLLNHRRWKILYDPVQIIIKKKSDPFIKYWSLLKNNIGAVDVRDCIVGKGFKPPGFGDAKIKEVLHDVVNGNYKGWLFLEPNLGRRYGRAASKSETFDLAIEGLKQIIGQNDDN